MKKTFIIIQREYLSRVKKKSFLIFTLLVPLLLIGASILIGFITAKSSKKLNIAIVDETQIFVNKIADSTNKNIFTYLPTTQLADVKKNYEAKGFDMLVHILPFKNYKPDSVNIYSPSTISLSASNMLNDKINDVYQNYLMEKSGVPVAQIDSLKSLNIELTPLPADKKASSSEASAGIGMFTGLLIYLFMFIYGTMVMRGVSEEKTNRIAEVIISSVKPFELMMGKIIGIALVGLTQFAIWIIFVGLVTTILSAAFPHILDANAATAITNMPHDNVQKSQAISEALNVFKSINWLQITAAFIFYFLGGYLLYAALFAAIGSLVNEDAQEAQQMTMPITMPIIFGFVIMQQAIRDPNSGIAIFGSLFPLTSPIVMMARIPYGVPTWQLLLSILFLILGFLFTTWLSAKIYRTGILMYGKKISWKEVGKWLLIKS